MKKLISILSVVALVLSFAACSSNGNKTVKPESLEFTSGTVGKYFKILDEPAELSFVEKDGQYFLNLKVKCQKTTDDFVGMNPADIRVGGLLSVAIVQLKDKDKIESGEPEIADPGALYKLLVSPNGTVSELLFQLATYHEDTPDWFKDAVYFSPYLIGDIIVEEAEKEEPKKETHLATLKPEDIKLPSSLKKAVEIVPGEDGNIYMDFDSYGYPSLDITFKLLKNVSTAPLSSSYGQMWIVGHAQDEKGRNIDDLNPKSIVSREWRSGDSDGSQFKSFLEGEVGETITLTFTGENNIEYSEDDPEKIKEGKKITTEAAAKCKRFKLSLSK